MLQARERRGDERRKRATETKVRGEKEMVLRSEDGKEMVLSVRTCHSGSDV